MNPLPFTTVHPLLFTLEPFTQLPFRSVVAVVHGDDIVPFPVVEPTEELVPFATSTALNGFLNGLLDVTTPLVSPAVLVLNGSLLPLVALLPLLVVILISLNCSSKSLRAAYLSADGVELSDDDVVVLEDDNGRPKQCKVKVKVNSNSSTFVCF